MERVLKRLFQLTEIRLNSKIVGIEEIEKGADLLKLIERVNSMKKSEHPFSDEVMETLTKKKYIHPSELASYYLHAVGEECHSFDDFEREPTQNKKLRKLQRIYCKKNK
jgi:hypothetical protein